MTRPAPACATLVPEAWRKGVPGAPLPAADTAGAWVAFADAQTAQLERANDRTLSSIEIVERCEAREREAAAKVERRGWFGRR